MKLPRVHRKVAKGRTYYYFDTGQRDREGRPIRKRLPDPRDPTFGRVLADCQRALTMREAVAEEMTVARLIRLFERSHKFTHILAPASRRNYRIYLTVIEDQIGPAPASGVEPKDARRLLEKFAERPSAANMTIRTLGALYAWAIKAGHVAANPTKGVEYLAEGEHEPWPEWLLRQALASDAPMVRLSTALLYYTAQRMSDMIRMRWSDVRGDRIEVVQQKTGARLAIRIHADLAKVLAETPRVGLTILSRPDAKPYCGATVRNALQQFAKTRGVHVVPHGLRKNAVNALLEAGCSAAETAAISGQSFAMIEHYAKRRSQPRLGDAAVLKWERNG